MKAIPALCVVTSLALLSAATPALAQATDAVPRALSPQPALPAYEVTFYWGHGVDSDLPDLPKNIVTGDLKFEKSYFAGFGVAWPMRPPGWMQTGLGWVGIERATTAVEVVGVKHWGRQNVFELGALYLLRSPYGYAGPVRARVGAGLGFSYTFGRPGYEDGPRFDPDRRYRFQNFDAFELELGVAALPRTALVTRVHHRSGMYGLIAPRKVGSNFLTLAIRHQF